jgi:alkanesulfonate monooxygenase SsuD/methylene tetrahydromethanopterin reductase-like flavin-dependent oxidoreductase (luciferase family)
VLHVHNDVVTKVTGDQGGTIVKGQGDGFMLAFPSARRALTCAQAIERAIDDAFPGPGSMIRVRIGIHVGETVQEADDFFGHAVNYAIRIASAAEGGEIVVSELVHALVAQTGEFTFEEHATWSSRASTVPRSCTRSRSHRRWPSPVSDRVAAASRRAPAAASGPPRNRSEVRRRSESSGFPRTLRSGLLALSRGA